MNLSIAVLGMLLMGISTTQLNDFYVTNSWRIVGGFFLCFLGGLFRSIGNVFILEVLTSCRVHALPANQRRSVRWSYCFLARSAILLHKCSSHAHFSKLLNSKYKITAWVVQHDINWKNNVFSFDNFKYSKIFRHDRSKVASGALLHSNWRYSWVQ